MTSLKGQIAVVTGAGSGIGKAMALALAEQGAVLCLVGRNSERLEAVAKYARNFSSDVSIHKTDLGIDRDIHLLAAGLKKDFGGVDILIHSAGVISIGRFEDASIEDFDFQYKINVRAAYLLTQEVLPMLREKKGQVVFMNSSVGVTGKGGVGQYAASKHALKGLADSLREEVNADGVRVLSVYLGRTATPMQAALHEMEEKKYVPERLLQPEDIAEVVLNALGLSKTAEVTDIFIRPLRKP